MAEEWTLFLIALDATGSERITRATYARIKPNHPRAIRQSRPRFPTALTTFVAVQPDALADIATPPTSISLSCTDLSAVSRNRMRV